MAICRALAAAAALLAAAAPAQPASAQDLVEAVTLEADGQLTRFHDPVCPLSEGLPADYNRVIEARVRSLARAAGIAIARRGCRPNLVVLVAEDPVEAVDLLRRRRPDIFVGLDPTDIRRVLAADGPVRSWRSSEARRIEGAPIAETRDSVIRQEVHLVHGIPASLLRERSRRDLRLSVVLFDLASIDGLSLMQIADHAAMRALAATRPASVAAGRSILGLFEPQAGARLPAATPWDLAYLRALYRSDGALRASAQRVVIGRLIERDLQASPR